MKNLENLNTLIDRASEKAGNDNQLARMIPTTRQTVSDWRHGRKDASPVDQALMAQIAGMDPVDALARATIEQYKTKRKGARIKTALAQALKSWE